MRLTRRSASRRYRLDVAHRDQAWRQRGAGAPGSLPNDGKVIADERGWRGPIGPESLNPTNLPDLLNLYPFEYSNKNWVRFAKAANFSTLSCKRITFSTKANGEFELT